MAGKQMISLGETTDAAQPRTRRESSAPSTLERWPVRVSQGASPQVQAMLIDPQDNHGAAQLSDGPIPFRIPRLASSDINAWGSIASAHHPYTQGGYSPAYAPASVGGIERPANTKVASVSRFVFHSRIPALSNDRRARAFAMRGSASPSAGRMNIPASFVPTAPISR